MADSLVRGFLDAANFEKLLAVLPVRLRPFVLLLYTTGVRTGEARKIPWSQVEFYEGVVQRMRERWTRQVGSLEKRKQ